MFLIYLASNYIVLIVQQLYCGPVLQIFKIAVKPNISTDVAAAATASCRVGNVTDVTCRRAVD